MERKELTLEHLKNLYLNSENNIIEEWTSHLGYSFDVLDYKITVQNLNLFGYIFKLEKQNELNRNKLKNIAEINHKSNFFKNDIRYIKHIINNDTVFINDKLNVFLKYSTFLEIKDYLNNNYKDKYINDFNKKITSK